MRPMAGVAGAVTGVAAGADADVGVGDGGAPSDAAADTVRVGTGLGERPVCGVAAPLEGDLVSFSANFGVI